MNKQINLVAFKMLIALTIILVGCDQSDKEPDNNSLDYTVVLLKFKAQPNKGDAAVSELKNLLDKVKDEPNFISIKLHVDPNDDTNILLYEKWGDLSYYQNEHMNTAHLQAFMENSINFLNGPPEVTFWEIKNIVK